MSWNDEQGHELAILEAFADEMIAGSGQRDSLTVSYTPEGRLLPYEQWAERPKAEVTGWVVMCTCPDNTPAILARWTRAGSPAGDNLASGMLYATDEEVESLDARDDVADRAQELWAAHRRLDMATEKIELAGRAVKQATSSLNEAVAIGRAAGLSWTAVGRAVGITRQSARERWGKAEVSAPAVRRPVVAPLIDNTPRAACASGVCGHCQQCLAHMAGADSA